MRRRRGSNDVGRGGDLWPIRKVLTSSDVDTTHPFLTLPRQPVEDHILVFLTLDEQQHLSTLNFVNLNVLDCNTGETYEMKLKWRGSYYNLIGKWGNIVRGKSLSMGMEIKMRWFNDYLHFCVPPHPHPVLPLQQLIAPLQEFQEWPITKVLTFSDVDTSHPFLPLPRQLVEDHIIPHMTQQESDNLRHDEQVDVNALDHDTGDMYLMKMKLRGNHYNFIGKWGKIIRRKGLGAGREIKLRWDDGCLYFSVPSDRNSIPSGRNSVPSGRNLVPSGRNSVSSGRNSVPSARNSVPSARNSVPSARNSVPSARNSVPSARNSVRSGRILVPSARNSVRSGRILVPSGRNSVPSGRDSVPSGRILVPSGRDLVPSGRNASAPAPLDQWPIKKSLTLSDIDTNHPFLTLPGKAVEDHILLHWTQQANEQLRKDGMISIKAQDVDTGDHYAMKLRWRGSYYNLIGKWGKIVREKELTVGKQIRVWWDNGCLLFSFSQ